MLLEAEVRQGQKGMEIIPVQTGKHCLSRSSFIIPITGFITNSSWFTALTWYPSTSWRSLMEIPGTAEPGVVLGLSGSSAASQQLFGGQEQSWGQVWLSKMPPHLLGVCLKLHHGNLWEVTKSDSLCKLVTDLHHRERNFYLTLEFLAVILSLVLQIWKGIHGGGREELSTFSGENTSAKHCKCCQI